MKRIFSTILFAIIAMIAFAQSDVVSVTDAISIFKSGKLANARSVLEKQGYSYKGVSTLPGKDYCWSKNVELSKDFLPQRYGHGNSSVFMLSTDGKTAFLYVYNQKAFSSLQAQVKQKGYEMQKEKGGTLLCTHDKMPTISFMQFQMPFPFCMMITE